MFKAFLLWWDLLFPSSRKLQAPFKKTAYYKLYLGQHDHIHLTVTTLQLQIVPCTTTTKHLHIQVFGWTPNKHPITNFKNRAYTHSSAGMQPWQCCSAPQHGLPQCHPRSLHIRQGPHSAGLLNSQFRPHQLIATAGNAAPSLLAYPTSPETTLEAPTCTEHALWNIKGTRAPSQTSSTVFSYFTLLHHTLSNIITHTTDTQSYTRNLHHWNTPYITLYIVQSTHNPPTHEEYYSPYTLFLTTPAF